MATKLFDSELKVMEVLWSEGDKTAKELARILNTQVGWSKTTTYTVIKKCVDKGAIKRSEPDFLCHPVITKDDARKFETTELINKMFGGSHDMLIASLLGRESLSSKEIEKLKNIIDGMDD